MMLHTTEKCWVCGFHSLSRAPRTENGKPTNNNNGERIERYSKGRILGLNLQVTSVPLEFLPL